MSLTTPRRKIPGLALAALLPFLGAGCQSALKAPQTTAVTRRPVAAAVPAPERPAPTAPAVDSAKLKDLIDRMASRRLTNTIALGVVPVSDVESLPQRHAKLEAYKASYRDFFARDTNGSLADLALKAEKDPQTYYQLFLVKAGDSNPQWIKDLFSYNYFHAQLTSALIASGVSQGFLREHETVNAKIMALSGETIAALQGLAIDYTLAVSLNLGEAAVAQRSRAYNDRLDGLVKTITAPYFKKRHQRFAPPAEGNAPAADTMS